MDLNSLQEFLPHWQLALDPAALGSSLVSLAVAWGFARMFRHFQRGKRIGTLSVPVTVIRSPGWFKTLMTRWGLPERATQPLVTGLATAAFVGITYFGFDRIDLPGKPLVPAVLAVLTALNLLWLARASKGICVGYERGLLIEGGFRPFEKLRLDRQGDALVLTFGKASLPLSFAEFERNKAKIRDTALQVKFETLKGPLGEKDGFGRPGRRPQRPDLCR